VGSGQRIDLRRSYSGNLDDTSTRHGDVMEQMAKSLVMTLWSAGGQGTARRNAWTAMAADAKRARQRTEVAAYLNAVAAVHEMPRAAVGAAHG
jgi:hypothetical protein